MSHLNNKHIIFSIFIFFVLSGTFVYTQVNEQEDVNSIGWSVVTYIWNERTNLLARTSCYLTNQILNNSEGENVSSGTCNPNDMEEKYEVLYWHIIDPLKGDNQDQNNSILGKLTGKAYSPVLGEIWFSEHDFNGFGDCYGISGDNRQPRLEKGTDGVIRLLGCAYVPTLNTWILFSRKGNGVLNIPGLPSSTNWVGTTAVVETGEPSENNAPGIDIKPPYLLLKGCGWSRSEGFWVLGTDVETARAYCTGTNNSLRLANLGTQISNELHNGFRIIMGGKQKQMISDSAIGIKSQPISVEVPVSKVRFGQSVSYTVLCSTGLGSASYATVNEGAKTSTTSKIISFLLRAPIETFILYCQDKRNFFSVPDKLKVAGVDIVSFSFTNTKISPSLLTEGGFVYIKGKLLSFVENASCKITNSIDANSRSISSSPMVGIIKDISEPFFVSRDVEFLIQCSFGADSSLSKIKTFFVKVLPNKLSERVVRKDGIIDAEIDGTNIKFVIPKDITSLRIYTVSATDDISDEDRYISESNLETLSKCTGTEAPPSCFNTIGCGESDTSCNTSNYKKLDEIESAGNKIIKVLVVDGVYADGLLTKRSCFGFPTTGDPIKKLC